MSKPLTVIPARMGSTRFPGKPLAEIAGVSLLRRTADVAVRVPDTDFVIATDHSDIVAHCEAYDLPVVMTSSELASGSDRARAAAGRYAPKAEIIVNLQGDAPFTDPAQITAVIARLEESDADIATPVIQLEWSALDTLREAKQTTPFSGTTAIVMDDHAVWFSKQIVPAIRKEAHLRMQSDLSPVYRHVGLYAYRRAALDRYTKLPISTYEALEGLEQLRALENGMRIATVVVPAPPVSSPGIDTPEDVARAEALIAAHGDPFRGNR